MATPPVDGEMYHIHYEYRQDGYEYEETVKTQDAHYTAIAHGTTQEIAAVIATNPPISFFYDTTLNALQVWDGTMLKPVAFSIGV